MAAVGFEIGGQEKGATWSDMSRRMCIRRWGEVEVGGEGDGRRWAGLGRVRVWEEWAELGFQPKRC